MRSDPFDPHLADLAATSHRQTDEMIDVVVHASTERSC